MSRLQRAEVVALGVPSIPATVVYLQEIVRGECAENAIRKDVLPSEAVAIERAMEPLERAEAEKRMKAGKPGAKLARGKTRNKVAADAGMKHSTLDKADALVAAAEACRPASARRQRRSDAVFRLGSWFQPLLVALEVSRHLSAVTSHRQFVESLDRTGISPIDRIIGDIQFEMLVGSS